MIYLVSTPLQLINAIEARQHFNVTDKSVKHALFIANFKFNTQKQIGYMLSVLKWDEVHFLLKQRNKEFNSQGLFLHHLLIPFKERKAGRQVIKYIRKENQLNIPVLFLGNYASRLFYLVATYFKGEKILLDDGAGSMEVLNLRKAELARNISHFFISKPNLSKRLGLMITGIKRNNIPLNIKFFSSFLDENDFSDVIVNRYNFFSDLATGKKKDLVVYFIGSPLVELGILERNIFLDALKKIKEYYKKLNHDFIYIQHRLEITDKILAIKTFAETKSFDLPVEAALINSELLPSIVASFYSAALLTSHMIFKDNIAINAFRITGLPYKKLDPVRLEEIYSLYQSYASDKFILLDIP